MNTQPEENKQEKLDAILATATKPERLWSKHPVRDTLATLSLILLSATMLPGFATGLQSVLKMALDVSSIPLGSDDQIAVAIVVIIVASIVAALLYSRVLTYLLTNTVCRYFYLEADNTVRHLVKTGKLHLPAAVHTRDHIAQLKKAKFFFACFISIVTLYAIARADIVSNYPTFKAFLSVDIQSILPIALGTSFFLLSDNEKNTASSAGEYGVSALFFSFIAAGLFVLVTNNYPFYGASLALLTLFWALVRNIRLLTPQQAAALALKAGEDAVAQYDHWGATEVKDLINEMNKNEATKTLVTPNPEKTFTITIYGIVNDVFTRKAVQQEDSSQIQKLYASLKKHASLDIDTSDQPQKGSFEMLIDNIPYTVEASFTPAPLAESLRMTIAPAPDTEETHD